MELRSTGRLAQLLLLPLLVCIVSAQMNCPEGMTTSFEKIVGYKPSHSRLSPMYSLNDESSKNRDGDPNGGGSNGGGGGSGGGGSGTNASGGTTADCIRRCALSEDCMGVMVNYDRNICFAASFVPANRREKLLAASDRANYFEKMCIRGPVCDKSFIMERVVGKELSGFDNRVISSIESRRHCEELCLSEQAFPCRSGEYDSTLNECRLSTEDRRSQPSSFRQAQHTTEYFENQCVTHGPNGCDYEQRKDVDLFRADQVRTSFSTEQCRAFCDGCKEFLCRSFSFLSSAALCALSSDDTLSVGSHALRARQGVSFYQKANCLDLQLTCNEEAMVLTLNTLEPFEGRIYTREENPPPGECEVQGSSDRSTTLAISLRNNRCGITVEGDGTFTNTVVIQHHPLIQQKGDRVIKLFCSFDAMNKTVTNTYKVLLGNQNVQPGTVNATAPSPNIRMRITDRNGADIVGAKLGDELYLRIETDDDSVFGIYARDLVARGGNREDDSIALLDNHGCPFDASIFPPLKKINKGKALMGKFEAFKFAEDVVVRFQVTVQFCLHDCPLPTCGGKGKGDAHSNTERDHHRTGILPPRASLPSPGGRIKRQNIPSLPQPAALRISLPSSNNHSPSSSSQSQAPVMPDYPLQREIIVEGIADIKKPKVTPSMTSTTTSTTSTSSTTGSPIDRIEHRHHYHPTTTTTHRPAEAEPHAHMVCASTTMVTGGLIAGLIIQVLIIGSCIACIALAKRSPSSESVSSGRSDHSDSPVIRHQHRSAYDAYDHQRPPRMRDYQNGWGVDGRSPR